MVTAPETLPAGPLFTPQQRLEQLQIEVQNARTTLPIAPDRRTTLQNSLNALRAEASLNQAELDRLDQEIQVLPTPPPVSEPSIEDALITAGMPLNSGQREQIRQATGVLAKIKKGIFMLLGSIPFLRKWAQTYLKEMGMEEYADELRSPEEKRKAEDEKQKREQDQRRQEAAQRQREVESRPEYIEDLKGRKQKAYATILIKAFYEQIGASVPAQGTKDDLTYARDLGTELANALDESQGEKFDGPCALELSGDWLQATDTHHGFWSGLVTLGTRDHDIPGMKNFGSDLKNDPEEALRSFLAINTGPLDTTSRNAIDTIKTALMSAEKTIARDLRSPAVPARPSARTPSAPRPAPTTTASSAPATHPTAPTDPPPTATV